MSIRIEFDSADVTRVIESLRDKSKSEESVFKKSINDTATKARQEIVKAAKKRYGGEAPKGMMSRSTIRKSTTSNLGAEIVFKSRQFPLVDFRVNSAAKTPTRTSYTTGGKRRSVTIRGTQMHSGSMPALTGYGGKQAFVIKARNSGKPIIVRRTSPWHKGETLKTFMGSSDRSMAGTVYEQEGMADRIAAMLHDNCLKALDAAILKG